MHELSPLPPAIPILSTTDTERLRELHPSLPSSPRACVTCKGTGQFRWLDDDGQPADWKCDCDEQFILHRYLLASGIELHYQRLRWADAEGVPPDALGVIEDYIEHCDAYVQAGLGLVLWGKVGTGKTMLAALLLKSLLEKGVRGQMVTFHTMLDLFTAGWEQKEAKVWFEQRITHADVLVLDDIGREHGGRNAVAESTLDHVLRSRVAADRPTIMTTNRTQEELGTLYSGNALSLLSESAIVQEFRGTDYRPEHQTRKITEAKARLTRPIVLA